MARLKGMIALVTGSGGTGSIGRATINCLAEEGADIAINDLPSRREEAEAAAVEITALNRRAILVLGDVSKVENCRRIVADTIAHFGRLDLLVNNAGGDRTKHFLEIDEAHYDQQVDLHLKAPFFLAQAAAKHMLEQGRGKIINIASELNYIGEPSLIPYSSAKGGLRTMTKSMALALSPSVTVNTVAPGPTATDEFKTTWEYTDEGRAALPLKRFVEPRDVGRSVVFLASTDGDAFTGQTLDPNCGAVMN